MSQHVVIGTAGHVDHGKTALVKALTGVDTDRWEEEKRRGITIDLGFAPLELGGGRSASVVDVPGHEDFIRNMVAGATGIDLALLVVAADEGIMPQTTEHLAILEFLGVTTGVVAVTKADLVEPDWVSLVCEDLGERLAASPIRWEGPVVVSAMDGRGLEELKATLGRAAERAAARSADDLFRMPVDRSFSVVGAGTVVTGTVWSGSVAAGEEVRALPGEATARVRSIEVHGAACLKAEPGRRAALALAGLPRDAVARGHTVVQGDAWRATAMLDVLLTLLPTARPLTQRSRVRLHLGTAEVMARVTPAEGEVAPGATAAVRLRLERPLVARWGDRGVIRSYSPVTTVGGCVVVDPWPPPRPRRPVALAARAVPDPVRRTVAFVQADLPESTFRGKSFRAPRGTDLSSLSVRLGVHPAEVERTVRAAAQCGVARVGALLLPESALRVARERILEEIAGYHRMKPLEPGVPRERVRQAVGFPALADAVQELLAAEGEVVLEGTTVRLAGFEARLSSEREVAGRKVLEELCAAGGRGRSAAELEAAVQNARELAEYLVREGTAIRVGADRYYARGALEELRDLILRQIRREGPQAPAELRDTTGLTRKYLIPVLEWLDAEGYTVRDGDVRRLGPAGRVEAGPA